MNANTTLHLLELQTPRVNASQVAQYQQIYTPYKSTQDSLK
jgi:hypothetical protein